jgi:hypothetical protein
LKQIAQCYKKRLNDENSHSLGTMTLFPPTFRPIKAGAGWANVRLLGGCLLWAVFGKIIEVAQIFGILFFYG